VRARSTGAGRYVHKTRGHPGVAHTGPSVHRTTATSSRPDVKAMYKKAPGPAAHVQVGAERPLGAATAGSSATVNTGVAATYPARFACIKSTLVGACGPKACRNAASTSVPRAIWRSPRGRYSVLDPCAGVDLRLFTYARGGGSLKKQSQPTNPDPRLRSRRLRVDDLLASHIVGVLVELEIVVGQVRCRVVPARSCILEDLNIRRDGVDRDVEFA